MYFVILIQKGTISTGLSTRILAIGSLALLLLTAGLFLLSIIARYRHKQYENKLAARKDYLYPYIMDYLEGIVERKEFERLLTSNNIDFIAFKDIIYELLLSIKGEEAKKLQNLLKIKPVYNYHCELLYSYFFYKRINAYNYFNYIELQDKQVEKKIKEHLYDKKQLVAFSAASALISSTRVSTRAEALESIIRRPHISRMAILEMLYKYHDDEAQSYDEEAKFLRKIIEDTTFPPKNISIIIRGVSEIGYYQLYPLLKEKFYSNGKWWKRPEILSALIEAMGNFYDEEASNRIRQYIYHSSGSVRKACVEALSKIPLPENFKALFYMISDEDFDIKFRAVEALFEGGEEGKKWLAFARKLEKSVSSLNLYVDPIIDRIEARHDFITG